MWAVKAEGIDDDGGDIVEDVSFTYRELHNFSSLACAYLPYVLSI